MAPFVVIGGGAASCGRTRARESVSGLPAPPAARSDPLGRAGTRPGGILVAVPDDHDVLVARLLAAFELHRAGVALQRQNIRRQHPGWTEAQVDERLGEWLAERPGAEHGDADGVPVPWPRAPR